jgi:putative ABC transport system substrate-binding protein
MNRQEFGHSSSEPKRMMRRREFLVAVGGIATAWPADLQGQGADRIRLVGIQLGTSQHDQEQRRLVAAMTSELARLGWVEGRNVRFEYRWGDGDPVRIQQQAADLVALAPDAIFAQGTPVVTRLKGTTRDIPIVFINLADPVGGGIVASLARPGGNLTGFTNYELSMTGKWLEILKELAPRLVRVLIVANPDSSAGSRLASAVEQIADRMGVTSVRADARSRAAIERDIDAFGLSDTKGMVIMPDFLTTAHRSAIIERANRARAPSMFPFRLFAIAGGLASYAVNQADTFKQAADYVDRILRGIKPSDLPVQAPTNFQLVINMRTARMLGLTVSPTLLARADEVIE